MKRYILLAEDDHNREMDVYTTEEALNEAQREVIQTFEPYAAEANQLVHTNLGEAWALFVEHAAQYNVFYDVREQESAKVV